jgi:formylglycine-generating enzyme required for sulfatase activity
MPSETIISKAVTPLRKETLPLLLWALGIIACGAILLGWYHSRLRVWQRHLATERSQLQQGRARLDQSWQRLEAARRQLTADQHRLEVATQQLESARERLRQQQERLDRARGRLEADQQTLQHDRQRLAADRQDLQHEQALLHEAQLSLEAARRQLAEEWQQFKTTNQLFTVPALTWRNSIGMEFSLIPAGEFQMGSDNGRQDEKPVHKVRISRPFYLGTYEVTQQQWIEIMGDNPSQYQDGPRQPVENVSWEDVQEFIRRLNQHEGGSKYRLPSEAEWEFAASGDHSRQYPWGNRFDGTRLNFCDRRCAVNKRQTTIDDGHGQTAPVGSYENGRSPFGVYDMAGNVWEWVQDRYGPYSWGMITDPHGPSSGPNRVLRGGSWIDSSRCCRVADRFAFPPTTRSGNVGFRLLRIVEE